MLKRPTALALLAGCMLLVSSCGLLIDQEIAVVPTTAPPVPRTNVPATIVEGEAAGVNSNVPSLEGPATSLPPPPVATTTSLPPYDWCTTLSKGITAIPDASTSAEVGIQIEAFRSALNAMATEAGVPAELAPLARSLLPVIDSGLGRLTAVESEAELRAELEAVLGSKMNDLIALLTGAADACDAPIGDRINPLALEPQ